MVDSPSPARTVIDDDDYDSGKSTSLGIDRRVRPCLSGYYEFFSETVPPHEPPDDDLLELIGNAPVDDAPIEDCPDADATDVELPTIDSGTDSQLTPDKPGNDPESSEDISVVSDPAMEEGEEVGQFVNRHSKWWLGESGVVDLRRFGPPATASSGVLIRKALYTISRLIGEAGGIGSVRYKVGMARRVFLRWHAYAEDSEQFSHMFILASTATREGANYFEAALISHNWEIDGCINRARRDLGGTGRGCDGPCIVYVVARRMP